MQLRIFEDDFLFLFARWHKAQFGEFYSGVGIISFLNEWLAKTKKKNEEALNNNGTVMLIHYPTNFVWFPAVLFLWQLWAISAHRWTTRTKILTVGKGWRQSWCSSSVDRSSTCPSSAAPDALLATIIVKISTQQADVLNSGWLINMLGLFFGTCIWF